jgi:hypothetical protein
MPTLSFEGSVYLSTAVDRREMVHIAPSVTVDMIMNRAQTTLPVGETHEVHFDDLPGNKATVIMVSVSTGDVTVTLTDDASDTAAFQVTPSGMLILLNTPVSGLTMLGNADSVYDLIAGG